MRVLAINGSERAEGSTASVARVALARASARGWDTALVNLAEHSIKQCTCGSCNSRSDPCPVDDDISMIVQRMVESDAIILAGPVHGFGLSALMQLFIERAGVGVLRFDRPLTNKLGAAIVTGRRYSLNSAHSQLVDNLLLNRLVVLGAGFPAVVQTGGEGGPRSDQEGIDAVCRTVDRILDFGDAMRETGFQIRTPESIERRVGRIG